MHVAVVSYLKKIVLSSDSLCVAPYVNFARSKLVIHGNWCLVSCLGFFTYHFLTILFKNVQKKMSILDLTLEFVLSLS